MQGGVLQFLGQEYVYCKYATRFAILATGCAATVVYGQPQPATDAAPETEDEYVDQLIADGNLKPLLTGDDSTSRNTSGNLRSLMVELGGARITTNSQNDSFDTSALDRPLQEAGILVSGRYETDNFGTIGLEAQIRRGSSLSLLNQTDDDRWNGLFKLSTDDLPLGDGWLADGALGATSTPLIGLLDRQTRFFLPVTPIMGAAISLDSYKPLAPGQVEKDPVPFAGLNLSIGEPGLLGGLRLNDYTGLSGLLISGGGQIEISRGLTIGGQAIAVDNTRDPFAAVLQTLDGDEVVPLISSGAVVGSLGYVRPGFRVQANAIWSTRSSNQTGPAMFSQDGEAFGGSLDISYRKGRTSHNGGLYHFGPGLTWGASAILSNAYGAYYRLSRSSQRWRWTFNIDAIDSVNDAGASGVVINADTRRNIGFTTAVGLNSSLRFANGQSAGQFLGYIDFETGLGTSRAEAGWSKDPFADFLRVGLVQNWSLHQSLPVGSRLSTQIAYQYREQSEDVFLGVNRIQSERADGISIAANFGLMPFKDVTLDANIAYSSDASSVASEFFGPFQTTGASFGSFASQQTDSFAATLVASARLSDNWSLSGSYTDTTSSLVSRFGIPVFASPLGPDQEQLDDLRRSSFRLRAAYLTLRYSHSAGRPRGTIGNRQYPLGGAGNIIGWVYLDANGNGSHDPAEQGVQGILVILDGRDAVRTNEAGFYQFRGVADGQHRITVNADNLPLPWFIESAGKDEVGMAYAAAVEVKVRGTTQLDIAATR
ncbi:SdrD B-like domain-containing protein [Erythrobacter sp. T5W1-R]|uniref:SdrD B-like domain-containing protein n=1 Tax=Erythrobacter sp. T5W1-R TaxID=3101752 RepID=UPI002AFE42DC|nr:SdrD B-like domain-containing protein [Erythrobacter sp. T5W1-R]MEA1619938.1 SdrD B-like domain-containing protein [Erythrobacter sp. T5W1-R]